MSKCDEIGIPLLEDIIVHDEPFVMTEGVFLARLEEAYSKGYNDGKADGYQEGVASMCQRD